MAFWLHALVYFVLMCHVTSQDTFLFASSFGDDFHPPGLYGALVHNKAGRLKPKETYDFNSGYRCSVNQEGNRTEGLMLRSVAYDPITGHVLLQRKEADAYTTLTLYEGHVCQDFGCNGTQHGDIPNGMKILFDAHRFSPSDAIPVSFAMYNGIIYFITHQKKQVGRNEQRSKIELRRFKGCTERYPITAYVKFNLDACSELLALLVDETATYPKYEPMAGLKVVQLEDETFVFLTLQQIMFNSPDSNKYDRLEVSLYMVNLDIEGFQDNFYILHRQTVDKRHRTYIMSQLGNIDYKDKKVCWSTIDRIVCSDFNAARRTLRNHRYMLNPGEAVGTVCQGYDVYANVTSGVAIADVTHEVITLFFGCAAGVPGMGGLGYVKLHNYEFEVRPTPKSIFNGTLPVYAGQMFLTHKCQSAKGENKPLAPVITDESNLKEPKYGQSAQGASTDIWSARSNIAFLITIIYSYLIHF